MSGRVLRIVRTAVSLVFMLVLTAALTAAPLAVPGVAAWMERIQFLPAVMSFSLAIFAVWLLITLVFGRVYCSSVCPLGTLQDASRRAALWSGRGITMRWRPASNRLRYTFLIVILVALMGGYFIIPSVLDPYTVYARICDDLLSPVYSAIAGRGAGVEDAVKWESVAVKAVAGWASTAVAIVTLAVTAGMAWRHGRLLCNTVCPVGTTLGLISRFSIFQIYIDTDRCTNCRRCEYACKANCINLNDHVVDGSRCVDCFNCLTACHDDAIHYTFRRKQLSIPMLQSIRPLGAEGSAQLDGASGPNETNKTDNTSNETIS